MTRKTVFLSVVVLSCFSAADVIETRQGQNSLLPPRIYECGIESGLEVHVFKTEDDFLLNTYSDGTLPSQSRSTRAGVSRPGEPVAIPECCMWYVSAVFSDELLSEIRKHNIPGLALHGASLSVGQLASLSTLKLRYLSVEGLDVTDAGLEQIAASEQLQYLDLFYSPGITDAGLEYLSNMKQLRVLDMRGCKAITDVGLEHVARIKQLEALALSDGQITHAGLKHIQQLTQLKCLNLAYRSHAIYDMGLEHISMLHEGVKRTV